MLIVIEGPDGCGKSSVAAELGRRLNAVVLHFPADNTVTGPMLRSYLRRQWWVDGKRSALELFPNEHRETPFAMHSALAFQALHLANRMEHWQLLNAASQLDIAGPRVIAVRYWQSGWVYGGLDGLSHTFLRDIAKGTPAAHLNLLLDISADEAMRRRRERDAMLLPERYEACRDNQLRIVDAYRQLWALEAGPRWSTIDAHEPLQAVCETAYLRVVNASPL